MTIRGVAMPGIKQESDGATWGRLRIDFLLFSEPMDIKFLFPKVW
jgi:hypothetical protein